MPLTMAPTPVSMVARTDLIWAMADSALPGLVPVVLSSHLPFWYGSGVVGDPNGAVAEPTGWGVYGGTVIV